MHNFEVDIDFEADIDFELNSLAAGSKDLIDFEKIDLAVTNYSQNSAAALNSDSADSPMELAVVAHNSLVVDNYSYLPAAYCKSYLRLLVAVDSHNSFPFLLGYID